MKKTSTLLMLILCAGFIFTGCKKGENDPFLSMKTRKARVCGEFTVSNYESTYINTTNNSTSTEKLEDGILTITDTDTSGTTITKYPFAAEFTFKKDGSFERSITTDSYQFQLSGSWYFVGKNKDADLKNKEAISLTNHATAYTITGNPQNSYTYQSNFDNNGDLFILNRLKEKEIVLQKTGEYDNGNSYNTLITLTKK